MGEDRRAGVDRGEAPPGFRIRDFNGSEEDYRATADVWNASFPDERVTARMRRHRDKIRQKQFLFQRLIGEMDGKPVADGFYGEDEWSHLPGKYILGIQVVPEYRGAGLGGAVYEYILRALEGREPAPTVLSAYAREDGTGSIRFIEKRGFRPVQRNQFSKGDVRAFDPAPFEETLSRVEESGVKIRPFGELMTEDPDALRKAYEIGWEYLQDVPFPDPITKMPFEQYLAEVEGPDGMPESWFVAVHNGEYVGMTQLWKNLGDPELLQTGLTGVARSHRRRGVATALKVRAIMRAKELGAKAIRTDNEENNPMYLLNVKLGFKPIPSWVVYKNELTGGSGRND